VCVQIEVTKVDAVLRAPLKSHVGSLVTDIEQNLLYKLHDQSVAYLELCLLGHLHWWSPL